MTRLKQILMERDELTSEEADDLIKEMRDMIYYDFIDPGAVLEDMAGLEEDYVDDLI